MKFKRSDAAWLLLTYLSLGMSSAISAAHASARPAEKTQASQPAEHTLPPKLRAVRSPPPNKVVKFSKDFLAVRAGKAPYLCPYCDLHGANLAGANLSNANLHGANLTGANLSGATLAGAELADANLTEANLNNAVLESAANGGTDLSRANLSGATLVGANLLGADLEYADLSGSDLSRADLSSTHMGPAPHTGLYGKRKTTFTKAKVPDGLTLNEASSVLTELQIQPHTPASKRSAFEYNCGSSDLSGLTSAVYVATNGNDSANCGRSVATACKSVARGLENCAPSGCGVLVAYGQYPQTVPLTLRSGVNVYGGCVAPPQSSTELLSLIQAPPGGAPAVSASGISTTTSVQNLKILATAATVNGGASIALLVGNSPGLDISNSEIYAAQGAVGANGNSAGAASVGGAGSGRSAGTNGACTFSNGGRGAGVMGVSVHVSGISFTCALSCENGCQGENGSSGSTGRLNSGGSFGEGDCVLCPSGSGGGTGNAGTSGTTASCGSKGNLNADAKGSFSGLNWVANVGGPGNRGGDGGGGGGGGSGGYHAGTCFGVVTEEAGNAGGGGGAGGCGGSGGGGGQQGGGSFAVVNFGAALSINRSRIIGGLSGNGGTGGQGAIGGAGGAASTDGGGGSGNAGSGGTGGIGGGGGGGGGGAGGNAGPAVNVALVSGGSLRGSDQVYYLGASGIPGSGGSGAASGADGTGAKGTCTAPAGDKGIAGLVANQQSY